ncbi:MAG: hypothetical protein KKA31_02100 [Candidatus Margulisbacteria bacterium]|nr:hypothetical protein [Candidatus Margulisiibacteriota bacterium]
MLIVWLKFIICAAIIFFAGQRLTKYGDAIAEKTGLSRTWIGIVLLAIITSLPEMANGISAAAIANVPDLAFGDILGACMINMFNLALFDMFWRLRGKGSIFLKPQPSNILSAFFGVVMLVFVALALLLSRFGIDLNILGISVYSLIMFFLFMLFQRYLFTHSKADEIVVEEEYGHLSNFRIYLSFFIMALIVIAAGSWLPFIGGDIVAVMGWGKTFVAVLFLGFATTLPEATVSISALRLGEIGMAKGNLLGSNIFNVSLIFFVDIFYRQGSLFAAVSSGMIFAALFGAVLMLVAYVTLRKRLVNGLSSYVIMILYVLSLFFLFKSGALS